MRITRIIRSIRKPKYKPLNHIEIIEKNILSNLACLQSIQPGTDMFPVLKSNAYGHGLEQMSRIIEKTDVRMVIVDSFPEAQIVYEHSSKDVLLLGEASASSYKYCNAHRTQFVVYNIDTLQELANRFHRPKVHLFVNTGMNREGIGDIEIFLHQAKNILRKVNITGICSHLASADIISDLTEKQTKRFLEAVEMLHQQNIFPAFIHLGNSAGVFVLHDKRLTAFRPGIALYGYNVFARNLPPYKQAEHLQPALRVLSSVVSIQHVKKGESVSYLEKYRAPYDTTIAIIPFGYYEGLNRQLSNKGVVRINGEYCPIAGQVCMNLTCVDVQQLPIAIGDEVEVISADKEAPNSIEAVAQIEKTISYEVLVRLHGGIRREIV